MLGDTAANPVAPTIDEDPVSGLDSTQQAMAAAGVATETRKQQSYFGFNETEKFIFPDGITYVEYKKLNEGERRYYLDNVASDVRIQKGSGDMVMKMKQGKQREALLESSVCGWNLIDPNGTPLNFQKNHFNKWAEQADPKLIDKIYLAIQKANPWLMAEMTLEDIDQQIEELQDLRAKKIEDEEGKDS